MSERATATASSHGISLTTVVTAMLLAAKLFTERWSDLSWWWVFSPVLISFGIFFGILLIVALVMLGAWFLDKRDRNRRRKRRGL